MRHPKHFSFPSHHPTGLFQQGRCPALTLRSGYRATIGALTLHAAADWERMIAGDGSGPTEGPLTLGSGEGIGVTC